MEKHAVDRYVLQQALEKVKNKIKITNISTSKEVFKKVLKHVWDIDDVAELDESTLSDLYNVDHRFVSLFPESFYNERDFIPDEIAECVHWVNYSYLSINFYIHAVANHFHECNFNVKLDAWCYKDVIPISYRYIFNNKKIDSTRITDIVLYDLYTNKKDFTKSMMYNYTTNLLRYHTYDETLTKTIYNTLYSIMHNIYKGDYYPHRIKAFSKTDEINNQEYQGALFVKFMYTLFSNLTKQYKDIAQVHYELILMLGYKDFYENIYLNAKFPLTFWCKYLEWLLTKDRWPEILFFKNLGIDFNSIDIFKKYPFLLNNTIIELQFEWFPGLWNLDNIYILDEYLTALDIPKSNVMWGYSDKFKKIDSLKI